MTTEAQKIMQANREGIRFGAQEMKDRIIALFEEVKIPHSNEAEEFFRQLCMFDVSQELEVMA